MIIINCLHLYTTDLHHRFTPEIDSVTCFQILKPMFFTFSPSHFRAIWAAPGGFLSPPAYAEAYERQGLTCEPRLPLGAMAMAPPPLVPGAAMDPREQPALKSWAQDVGRGTW